MESLLQNASAIIPLAESVKEILSAAVSAEPVIDEYPAIHLSLFSELTIPEGLVDSLRTVASRYEVFETVIIDIAQVKDVQGQFVFQAAVVDSTRLSNLRSDIIEMLTNAGIEMLGSDEIAYHIPLSSSMDSSSIDSGAILNTIILVDEFRIFANGEEYSFGFDAENEKAFYISSTKKECNGYAVVRSEDGIIVSCHESETQARDALDKLIQVEGGRQDEKLINAESADTAPNYGETTMSNFFVVTNEMSVGVESDTILHITDETTDLCSTDGNFNVIVVDTDLSLDDYLFDVQRFIDRDTKVFFTQKVSAELIRFVVTELGAEVVDEVEVVEEFETEVDNEDDEDHSKELEALEVATDVLTLGASKQTAALSASGRGNEFETLMVLEGRPTGDNRQIDVGALTWRDLPLPFMFNKDNTGHAGSTLAGVITEIWREEHDGYNSIWGRGVFDNSAAGAEAKRMYAEGMMRGVSVDMDQVTASETFDGESADSYMLNIAKARIMGLTSLPFPAFQEAGVWIYHDPSEQVEELVASGAQRYQPVMSVLSLVENAEALVASGGIVPDVEVLNHPPVEWFDYNPMGCGVYPVEIDADGHVHGYVASFKAKSYHIGYLNQNISAPKTSNNYSAFRTGSVLCSDGSMVKTGRLTINTVHPKMAGEAFNKVQAFYDHSGSAIADVVAYDDDLGIFITGAVRPGATPEQLRVARASDWSPDWRRFDGEFQMVAILGVNLSGFIVDGLVASGGEMTLDASSLVLPGEAYIETDFSTGEVCTMIGCGKIRPGDEALAAIMDRMNVMQEELRELSEFRIATELKSILDELDD